MILNICLYAKKSLKRWILEMKTLNKKFGGGEVSGLAS